MTPINYLSLREAIDIVASAKFAGVPDRPAVIEARQAGFDVADGLARDEAVAELWRAVDQGRLKAIAHGPSNRRLRLSATLTKQVPLLRSPRGGVFTFLRPGNPAHERLAAQFGPNLGLVSLMFAEREVEKLARLNLRRHRRSQAQGPTTPRAGRPSRKVLVIQVVRKLVEEQKWKPPMPLKALARQVQRTVKWEKPASEDTVTRALDQLYEETKDRRFERPRRRCS